MTFRGLAALPLCAAGGAAMAWLGVPAPWLAGSMVVGVAAALCGLPVFITPPLRIALMMLLGVQIGGTITPMTIDRMLASPISISILALTVPLIAGAGTLFYRWVLGWDTKTAFFAANAGALSLSMILAERFNARVDRVAVIQCLRLFYLVFCLPLVVGSLGGDGSAGAGSGWTAGIGSDGQATVRDLALMLGAGIVAGLLAEWARVPAGALLGALFASAALHLGDVVHGVLPDWVMILCFVLIGMMISGRFQSMKLAELASMALAGTIGFAIALAIAATGAVSAAAATGLSLPLMLLSFGPGAIEVMVILGLFLGLDSALVAIHQVSRYLVVSITAPFLASWIDRRFR